MLGRPADPEGLSLFTSLVNGGTPLSTVQNILAYSPEAAAKLTTLITDVTGAPPVVGVVAADQTELADGTSLATLEAPLIAQATSEIPSLYEQVLGRSADPGGITTFAALVPSIVADDQTPIATIRSILAYSPEETSDLTAIYTAFNGTAPTADQISAYEAELAAGESQLAVEAPIYAPITQLYVDLLDRQPDSGGIATFVSLVEGGDTLTQVRDLIATSQEETSNINALYEQVLGRSADQTGISTFENLLENGTTLVGVRGYLAASQETDLNLTAAYQAAYGSSASLNTILSLENELAQVTGIGASGTTLAAVEASLADPLVIDLVASQTITTPSTLLPFAAASVLDPTAGGETATLTLVDASGVTTDANGTLSGAGVTETNTGVYTLTAGSAAALTTDLGTVTFTPTVSGAPVTTTLDLSIENSDSLTGSSTTAITVSTVSTPSTPTFIYSSVGDDAFSGTAISGGAPDIFAFTGQAVNGDDTISNFNTAQDVIQLSSADFPTYTAVTAATTVSAGSTYIKLDATDTIVLPGVTALTASNFRLV